LCNITVSLRWGVRWVWFFGGVGYRGRNSYGAPKSEPPPTRVGQTAYVRRGGADGAAGALNGRCWRWLTCWPSYVL
jgi:hypothetical protein